jgi:hypothetical protein
MKGATAMKKFIGAAVCVIILVVLGVVSTGMTVSAQVFEPRIPRLTPVTEFEEVGRLRFDPETGIVTLVQEMYRLEFSNANGMTTAQNWSHNRRTRERELQGTYHYLDGEFDLARVDGNPRVVALSSNHAVVEPGQRGTGLNERHYFTIKGEGTALLTTYRYFTHRGVTRAELHATITVTITKTDVTLLTAAQGHVLLHKEVLITQEEIEALIPLARPPAYTRHTTRHPDRAMTQQEINAWIQEYWNRGGLNDQELAMLHQANYERVERGITPLIVCPFESMGARLSSQISHEHPTRVNLSRHSDQFYSTAEGRSGIFGGVAVMEITASVSGGRMAVGLWLRSERHRDHLLTNSRDVTGVGIYQRAVMTFRPSTANTL